jgi:divalent metal cation (Fe/Co/Zn/Cd) transporter
VEEIGAVPKLVKSLKSDIVGLMIGVAGLGLGIWWTGAAVAVLISLRIFKDGVTNLSGSVLALMDEHPRRAGEACRAPLLDRHVAELGWMPELQDARMRLREKGHVYFCDITVALASERDVTGQLERISRRVRALEWRMHDIVVVPMRSLE